MVKPFNRPEIVKQGLANPITDGPVTISSGAGEMTNYYSLDPSRPTAVGLSHHASDAPTVEYTFTLGSHNDLEDSSVLWFELYDGSETPYAVGDSRGFSGVRVISNSPTNGDIDYEIVQYGRRN